MWLLEILNTQRDVFLLCLLQQLSVQKSKNPNQEKNHTNKITVIQTVGKNKRKPGDA